MDSNEDSTVTAATINVVCELGWRRPLDFLPLAPRLFELLVDGGNNWMAIKIIKLASYLPLSKVPRANKSIVCNISPFRTPPCTETLATSHEHHPYYPSNVFVV